MTGDHTLIILVLDIGSDRSTAKNNTLAVNWGCRGIKYKLRNILSSKESKALIANKSNNNHLVVKTATIPHPFPPPRICLPPIE